MQKAILLGYAWSTWLHLLFMSATYMCKAWLLSVENFFGSVLIILHGNQAKIMLVASKEPHRQTATETGDMPHNNKEQLETKFNVILWMLYIK